MIKNIVFDVGNVIWNGNSATILSKLDISEDMKDEIKNTFFKNTHPLDLGEETLEEHFYSCGISIKDEKIKDFLINYYKYRDLNSKIVKLIHVLKKNGYGIYILSNNNKEAMDYLMQDENLKCVDGWILSCDYAALKPEKRIYEILFDTFKLNPEECFFVDDKERNIKAGEQLGMKGHILDYKNYEDSELKKSLIENGVNI